MRKSTRIFVLLGVVEALIIAGAAFMVYQVTSGGWNAPDPAEAITRIMTVAGIAIPIFGFPFLILAVSLYRKGE